MILLLRVAVLLRDARHSQISRTSALLLVSIAAYVVDSAPGFYALDPRLRVPIHVLANGTAATFWMAMGAIFVDGFRVRWYHALAWVVLAFAALADLVRHPISLDVVRTALALACMLAGAGLALAGRAQDLLEWRRRLRVWYAVVTALYAVLIISSEWIWPGGMAAASLSFANAAGLTGFIFLFAVLGSLPVGDEQLTPVPTQPRQSPPLETDAPAAPPPNGPDALQLAALRRLIDHDKVFREPDLSITSLSQKLDIPEYRLRHLINQQLGHRNFSAFVNGYRLAEAETALGDPAQAGVPILTIALDAGFGSIGPFNRAFKAHTGQTPSEYRRARLGGAAAAEI